MELYANPILTTARPILLFVAENDLDFISVNPNGLIPALVDGDLRLTRTPAILEYLADLIHAPAYPADLHRRARINERMDWLSANFYRSFGCDPVYPQIFPQSRARAATRASAMDRATGCPISTPRSTSRTSSAARRSRSPTIWALRMSAPAKRSDAASTPIRISAAGSRTCDA